MSQFLAGTAKNDFHVFPVMPVAILIWKELATVETLELALARLHSSRIDRGLDRHGSDLLPVGDQSMGRVVVRDTDRDPVADEDTDAEFFHFAGKPSLDVDPIVEEDLIVSATRQIRDFSFKTNEIFFRHQTLLAVAPMDRTQCPQTKRCADIFVEG